MKDEIGISVIDKWKYDCTLYLVNRLKRQQSDSQNLFSPVSSSVPNIIDNEMEMVDKYVHSSIFQAWLDSLFQSSHYPKALFDKPSQHLKYPVSSAENDLSRQVSRWFDSEHSYLVPNWEPRPYHLTTDPLASLIGHSTRWKYCFRFIQIAAQSEIDVTLVGEIGTGKDLVAHKIHLAGLRQAEPFVIVPCAALTPDSILREWEITEGKGSSRHTGLGAAPGWLKRADAGALYFDGLEDLSLEAQPYVLQLFETARNPEYNTLFNLAPRLLVSSRLPLDTLVEQDRLRWDLFYRLKLFLIDLPPLRERLGDIPLLTKHFLLQLALKHGKRCPDLSPTLWQSLESYQWAGNILELRNVLEQSLLTSNDKNFTLTPLLTTPKTPTSSCPSDRSTMIQQIIQRLDRLGLGLKMVYSTKLATFLTDHRYERFRSIDLARFLAVSPSTARKYLNTLGKAGILQRLGSTKAAEYKVMID